MFLFDESGEKEITDLLKATPSPLSIVERSSKAEAAQVGSLDRIDDFRGALPVIETTEEVADTAPEMSVGPPTTELLPESETETTAPLIVDDSRLPSPPSFKRADTAKHSQAAEGTRAASDVDSQGTVLNPKNRHLDRPLLVQN